MRHLTALILGTMFLTLPLAAQPFAPRAPFVPSEDPGPPITARQAAPDEVGYIDVPSPMLLDISLGAHGYAKSLKDISLKDVWSTGETTAFVCDNVRLESVEVAKVTIPAGMNSRYAPRSSPRSPAGPSA